MAHERVNIASMCRVELKAYHIYMNQRRREGVEYGLKAFIAWYYKEFYRKQWKRAHVARKDHGKPYSFANIEMQEQAENNRERNARRGNPSRSHKAVDACTVRGKFVRRFPSKISAAHFYGISEKTVYNHCAGKTKQFFKFGKNVKGKEPVRFKWST